MEPKKLRWTAKELIETEFPELDWVVPMIMPEGFSVLGGRPKVGKSWLAMQIAHAVSTGGVLFGEKVSKGKVLYLALEDNPRRLARRIRIQKWASTEDCVFYNQWLPMNQGGLAEIAKIFDKEPHRLCVMDTVARAYQVKDPNDVAQMTRIYDQTHHFFEDAKVNLLAVDHHSKSGGGMDFDVIDSIISSTAKVAVPDTILGLAKMRGKVEARLVATGRDAEDFDEQVIFNKALGAWEITTVIVKENSVQADIVKVVLDSQATVSLTELAAALDKNKGQVLREANELVKKGLIVEGFLQTPLGREKFYTKPTVQ